MKNNELPIKLLAFTWYFLKKYKISFIFYFITSVCLVDTAFFFLQPYLLKVFFDKVNNDTITVFSGLLIIFSIAFSDMVYLINIFDNIFKFHSVTKVIEDIRDKIFSYSIRQSTSFFNNNFSGELVNKINSVTESIESVIRSIFIIMKNFLLLSIFVIILFYFSKILGFASILWLIIYSYISYYYLFDKKAKQSKLIQEHQNKINAFVNDDFMNIQNIKSFSNDKFEIKYLLKLLKNKFRKIYLEIKYTQISDFLFFILNFSMCSLIILVGIYQLKNSIINIGSFVFLLSILRVFIVLSREICWLNDSFKNIVIMNDSLGLITNDIEIKDKKEANKLYIGNGKIIFKDVKFKY